jgi:hypothetical protein
MSDPDHSLEGEHKTEGRVFETAQVKVIGLGDVRNAAGARMATMTFLQAALSDDDIVILCGDVFLVIYDERAGRDLEVETEALQRALNAFYLHQEAHPGLRANLTQRTMPSREVVGFLAGDFREKAEASIRFAPNTKSVRWPRARNVPR